MRYICSLVFFFFLSIGSAQETERLMIRGEILVPEGNSPDGIHIYNKTSGYGTASDPQGSFELRVAQGDTLHFSAVQLEELEVVISKETVNHRSLSVEISEGLNQLPEIVVLPHDLTGNLAKDAANIEVVDLPVIPSIKIYPGSGEDARVKNATMNQIGGGANHLSLLIKGIKLLFPKRKNKKQAPKINWTPTEKVVLEKELRSRFEDQFFENTLGISVPDISVFVGFVAKRGFKQELLQKDQEMLLIQFLVEESDSFLQ